VVDVFVGVSVNLASIWTLETSAIAAWVLSSVAVTALDAGNSPEISLRGTGEERKSFSGLADASDFLAITVDG
jgi:hypothetical protein